MSLTPEECTRILTYLEAGRSQRDTARIVGVALSTVQRVLQRFQETGSNLRRPGNGDLSFMSVVASVFGDLPDGYYEWAEPNSPEAVLTPAPLTRTSSADRLNALREIIAARNIDAYIIPTADAHNSQYIAPSDARREWLSGLTGSSGTALVTASEALLWTDGRYFTQFYQQVDTEYWGLMMQGTNVTINQWLSTLPPHSTVGVDPTTYTWTSWSALEIDFERTMMSIFADWERDLADFETQELLTTVKRIQMLTPIHMEKNPGATLQPLNINLLATDVNLVDEARLLLGDPPPARPNNPLIVMTFNFTGKTAREKIDELSSQIVFRGASALILTALDDIAYTLNLRGTDIPYNPVFFSYLLIQPGMNNDSESSITLFWGSGEMPSYIEEHLTSEGIGHLVVSQPYDLVFDHLRYFAGSVLDGSVIWLSQDASQAIRLAAEDNGRINTISTVSPVALMKCIKNEVELEGFRSVHVKDGTAVVRALRWLQEAVAAGQAITEIDLSDKLHEFRSDEEDFMGPSFATIAGAGENGAIIHYKPSREDARVIGRDDVVLVDSGGQYRGGTTDITRTRHMSTPSSAQRLAFTRVLKGQILMGTAVFPRGSTGNVLDTLARKSLWDVGLDYAHGTGHGVGHFLNVHEGPSGIGAGLAASDPGIQPGMIFSNEPGYYEVGEYGIRHEDLVEVIDMNGDPEHILASGMVGDFNGRGAVAFHTISMVPHQTSFLNISLLNNHEIKYLNDYHQRVLSNIGPILQRRGLHEDYDWLVRECEPIYSSAAILLSTPLLLLCSFSLWF